jgi:CHASE2 domain-containing sensor protein/predicted Ser/Thr protein kinase
VAARLARFSWLPGGLAAAFIIVVGRLISSATYAPVELMLYDRVMRATPTPSAADVAVIAIDNASISKLGEWPWPRDVHASLISRLSAAGARVVGFGVPVDTSPRTSEAERLRSALALLESSDLGGSQQAQELRRLLGESSAGRDPDAHLAEAMQAHGNVVLPADVRLAEKSGKSELPARLLSSGSAGALRIARTADIVAAPAAVLTQSAAAIGHTLTIADGDRTVRSDTAGLRVGDDAMLPSLGTAIAARALSVAPASLSFGSGDALHLNERTRLLGEALTIRPHYFPTQPPQFAQYPYWSVLAGDVPAEQLRDKIVLVGFLDSALAEPGTVATPASDASPAVLMTASVVTSIVSGKVYARPSYAVALEWIVAIAVILFAAFVLPRFGIALGALATVLFIVILGIAEVGLLSSSLVWVRFIVPALALVVGYGLFVPGELMRRATGRNEDQKNLSASSLRNLGQQFQRTGQLDLAFETYRRCPLDAATMELLYQLGNDFEKRRQNQKASNVYSYIAARDPNYRDLRARRTRLKEQPMTRGVAQAPPPSPQPQEQARTPPELETQPSDPDLAYAKPRHVRSTRTLGRYEIERELGKGAMGTVYLGRDPKINRVVAIKAIPLAQEFEEDDLQEARARFFREAEMAGRLNHPAIVTVYDAGEDQGLAYIAMEYLRGTHMSHFTEAARILPFKNTMLLVARVADALYYAHRQNVVHRDIKPANIMFNPDTDELKITDFGIARLTDTSRTKTGIVLGTPSFMSPEQLEGRPLDGRSDQFALGVSLYQLLCGQLPFRAESMPRLMQKIATEPHASVRLVRPELPECIDPILTRALAKSADDRFAHCGELASALRDCAGAQSSGQPEQAKHEWLIP